MGQAGVGRGTRGPKMTEMNGITIVLGGSWHHEAHARTWGCPLGIRATKSDKCYFYPGRRPARRPQQWFGATLLAARLRYFFTTQIVPDQAHNRERLVLKQIQKK